MKYARGLLDIALAIIAALFLAATLFGQEKKYETGLIVPKDIEARVAASWKRHGVQLQSAPKVTAGKYDAREMGLVGPIKDQGNCGSCYIFGAIKSMEGGLLKSGDTGGLKADGFVLSEQLFLDCYRVGGCGGGWPEDVLAIAKEKGVPLTSAYGPYRGGSGTCKYTNQKLFKVKDYGYVSNDSSVPSYQQIKDAVAKYGPLVVCVAADGNFTSYKSGVFKGNARNINHCVMICGWDDSRGTAGAVLVGNSWSEGWGERGYMWAEPGANQIGYGAMFTIGFGEPVPPEPIPPDPIPPIPPGPDPVSPTEWRFDPILKTITVPKDYTVKGGKHSTDVIDLAGLSPEFVLALRWLISDQRKRNALEEYKQMPKKAIQSPIP